MNDIMLPILHIVADAHDGTAAYRPSELLGGACFQIVLMQPPRNPSEPSVDERERLDVHIVEPRARSAAQAAR